MGALLAGRGCIDVSDELLKLARPRCHLAAFETSTGAPSLRVRRVAAFEPHAQVLPLEGVQAPWGEFAVSAEGIFGRIPDDPFAAEALLRAGFQTAVAREGGVLIHGSGFAFGESAFVAFGKSGAGKSTLARLCAAGGARLLSDEVIALYPDGSCHGSPFRSDVDLSGTPAEARLHALLTLHHAEVETLEPVPARGALPALLSQTFRGVLSELDARESFARVTALLDKVPVSRLSFRKHSAVADFLRGAIHASQRE